jgi:hypothetical protein
VLKQNPGADHTLLLIEAVKYAQRDLEVLGLKVLTTEERTNLSQRLHILFDNPQIKIKEKKKQNGAQIRDGEVDDAFEVFRQKYTQYQNVIATIMRTVSEMLAQVDFDSVRHYQTWLQQSSEKIMKQETATQARLAFTDIINSDSY